jgi:3-methylcrotonyl-CoA carboxylase alpha subunit
MLRALDDYRIAGVKNNLNFLTRLVEQPAFAKAELDTHFIERHKESLFAPGQSETEQASLLAALYLLLKERSDNVDDQSPWALCSGWRLNEVPTVSFPLIYQDETRLVSISSEGKQLSLTQQGVITPAIASLQGDELQANLNGHQVKVRVSQYQDTVSVFIKHRRYDFIYQTQVQIMVDDSAAAGSLTAPMNGTIVAVMVEKGALVSAGQTLLVMEAMKMEYSIKAPKDGVVNQLFYAAGDLVKDGAQLLDFTPAD